MKGIQLSEIIRIHEEKKKKAQINKEKSERLSKLITHATTIISENINAPMKALIDEIKKTKK